MKKVIIRLITGLVAVVVVVAILICLFWFCASYSPDFYGRRLQLNPSQAAQHSDAFLQKTALIADEVKRPGTWQITFREEEINGWLAVDLPQNHPSLLPPELSEPRVEIDDNVLRLAIRIRHGLLSGVAWVESYIYTGESNTVVVVIRRANLGVLPLPTQPVLDGVKALADDFGWEVQQTETDGRPTLRITIPETIDHDNGKFELHSVILTKGQLEISAKITPGQPRQASR